MSDNSCCYCDGELALLPSDHPEYTYTQLTADGTRKWFICKDCESVWCYDKLQKTWLMSPQTYTTLVNRKEIPDLLESD
jgi:hypothetical protein